MDGAIGDHDNVDGVGKLFWMEHKRCSYAYRRLVWRVAQRAIDLHPIWGAIEQIAEDLTFELNNVVPENDAPGEYTATLTGRDVKAIMHALKSK